MIKTHKTNVSFLLDLGLKLLTGDVYVRNVKHVSVNTRSFRADSQVDEQHGADHHDEAAEGGVEVNYAE